VQIFEPTGWSFVTSGGAEITYGLARFLFAGGSAGAFYVRKGASGPIQRLPFTAVVGGVGAGFSVAGPVTASVSLPLAPGGGYQIYRNPIRSSALELGASRVPSSRSAGARAGSSTIATSL